MSQITDRSNVYTSFPGGSLEKVAVRLVKEAPYLADGYIVDDVDKAIKLVGGEFCQFDREVVGMLNLKADLSPINITIVSKGAINRSIVHPPEMLKTAIMSNASCMMMVHNHPSGNVEPSDEDIRITKKMIFICELIGIPLIDHIIIGGNNTKEYYSFREMSLIDFKKNYLEIDGDKTAWFDNVAEKKEEYVSEMSR